VPAPDSLPQPPDDARRVRIQTTRLGRWLDNFADRHGGLQITAEPAQVLVTAVDGTRAWIDVPFPPLDISAGRVLTTLAIHANQPRRIGVLLVRRGGYAAGVFVGDELVASKVGSAYVQGGTKAGGWSQQRYARRRDNQAKAAFAEAADVAARILVPEARSLDGLILGGDRAACTAALQDLRLRGLTGLVREPFLAVGDPRLRVLQATPDQFRVIDIVLHP
jgi:VLRF1 release factor-like protein